MQGRGQQAATVATVRVGEVSVVVSLHWTWSAAQELPHTEPMAQQAALEPVEGSTIQLWWWLVAVTKGGLRKDEDQASRQSKLRTGEKETETD